MRVMFFDCEFPEYDHNSGGHRTIELIKILLHHNHDVSFVVYDYWHRFEKQNACYRSFLESMGVVCFDSGRFLLSSDTSKFISFISPHTAILSKYYIYHSFASYLRCVMPSCRLVLDLVDLHHLRELRMNEIYGGENWQKIKLSELSAIRQADMVWAISKREASMIKDYNSSVFVIPNIHNISTVSSRENRKGIVFVGNSCHFPNVDGLKWFCKEIYPLLISMGCKEKIFVTGHSNETYIGIENLGCVRDLSVFLNSCLVGIVPLRFGAGMKGKIGDYLSCGLPCVSTSIGVEGFDFIDNRDVFIRDTSLGFAQAIIDLCNDVDLWNCLSCNGMESIRRFSSDIISSLILEVLA